MALLAQIETTQANWWWLTLTSGRSLGLLGFAALCVAVLLWLGFRLRAISLEKRRMPIKQRIADDSGVAMVEFVLVTPILLMVTLLLIQTMLVFTGLFYVQHAAYAGARSAIVQIPSDRGLPPNEFDLRSDKANAVTSAAMVALMPVSGRESESQSGAIDFGRQLEQSFTAMYRSLGQTPPAWVSSMLAQRANYAVNRTDVRIERVFRVGEGVRFEPVESYTVFSPKEAVAVHVRHEFALSIPLASRLFTAVGDSGTYAPAGRSGDSPGPPGQWTAIQARAILTNEGIDRRLPPAPGVPRR